MNTEYKSISVSHIYTECLTDAVHLMAACPSGSRDCQDFFPAVTPNVSEENKKVVAECSRVSAMTSLCMLYAWQKNVC